jgi:hypothetical protein
MIEWPSLADALFTGARPERTIVRPERTIVVRPERTIVRPGSNEAVMPTTVATDKPNPTSIPISHDPKALPMTPHFLGPRRLDM